MRWPLAWTPSLGTVPSREGCWASGHQSSCVAGWFGDVYRVIATLFSGSRTLWPLWNRRGDGDRQGAPQCQGSFVTLVSLARMWQGQRFGVVRMDMSTSVSQTSPHSTKRSWWPGRLTLAPDSPSSRAG